jgi:hypothetical protein
MLPREFELPTSWQRSSKMTRINSGAPQLISRLQHDTEHGFQFQGASSYLEIVLQEDLGATVDARWLFNEYIDPSDDCVDL